MQTEIMNTINIIEKIKNTYIEVGVFYIFRNSEMVSHSTLTAGLLVRV